MRYRLSLFTLLLTLCMLSTTLHSQTVEYRKNHFQVGASGGASGSMMWFNPAVNQSFQIGYYGGFDLRMSNSKYKAFHARLSYSRRGWKEVTAGTESFVWNLDYIDLSTLAYLYYPFGRVEIGLELGPYAGYLINNSKRWLTEAHNKTDDSRRNLPIKHRFNWGVVGGPTVAVNMHRHRVELNGYFYFGLGDLFSTNLSDLYGKASEMALMVGLSYYFQAN